MIIKHKKKIPYDLLYSQTLQLYNIIIILYNLFCLQLTL